MTDMGTRDATATGKAELTEPERQLVAAAGTGTVLDFRTGIDEVDHPAYGGTWEGARMVRAEVLTELLLGPPTPVSDRPLRAVRLRGARILGQLDLEAATLACPLLLWDCYRDQAVTNAAQLAALLSSEDVPVVPPGP
jgi:hypothetical protein